MNIKTRYYKLALLLAATSLLGSCKDFLDLQPVSSPTETNFYVDVNGLEGAIMGIYNGFQAGALYGNRYMTLAEGRSDNIGDYNPNQGGGITYQFESFTETSANTILADTYRILYRNVVNANLVLESVDGVTMKEEQKQQIIGEAFFLRGLSYFHLVRLWGKVPLVTKVQTSVEARENKRAELPAVYAQIVDDLTKAEQSLPPSWPDAQRGRATSWAANAILGKVYLYQKNFSEVINTLKPVVDAINVKSELALVPQTSTFPDKIKISKDIIFAILFLNGGVNEGVNQNNRFRNRSNGTVIELPQSMFEANDNRKALVAPVGNNRRPEKYNVPAINNETSGDFPVMRAAEVMLMYAEALNEQSTIPSQDAFDALNAVRLNAGITPLTVATTPTKEEFRAAVYKERRLELALECDRWFDIVRTGEVATVFPLVPATRYVYPIPQAEIDNVNDKAGW